MVKSNSIVVLARNYRVQDNRVINEALKSSNKVYIICFLNKYAFISRNRKRSITRCIFELECLEDMNRMMWRRYQSRVMSFLSSDLEKTLTRFRDVDPRIRKIYVTDNELPYYKEIMERIRIYCRRPQFRGKKKIDMKVILDRTLLKKQAVTRRGTPYLMKNAFIAELKKHPRRNLLVGTISIQKTRRKKLLHRFCCDPDIVSVPLTGKKGKTGRLTRQFPRGEIIISAILEKLKTEKDNRSKFHGGRKEGLKVLKQINHTYSSEGIHAYLEFGCISWREYWRTLNDSEKETEYTRLFWMNRPIFFCSENYRRLPAGRKENRVLHTMSFDQLTRGATGHIFYDLLIRKVKEEGYLTMRERAVLANFIIEAGGELSALVDIFNSYLIDYNRTITTMMWRKVAQGRQLNFRKEMATLKKHDIKKFFPSELGEVSMAIIRDWYRRHKECNSSYIFPA